MKKIIAFILTISMLFSMVLNVYAVMDAKDLKQAIAGIWVGEEVHGIYGVTNGTIGLDDAYEHTTPRQKAEFEAFAAKFISGTGYVAAPAGDSVVYTDFSLTTGAADVANAKLAVKFFADAMTFPRKVDAITKNTNMGWTTANDWDAAAYYPTLIPLTDRFVSSGAAAAFSAMTNDKMNTAAMGALLLNLRRQFMSIIQTKSPADVMALFKEASATDFVETIRDDYALVAIINILENVLNDEPTYQDANLQAVIQELIANGMLLENTPGVPADGIDPDSKFIKMILAAFDFIEDVSDNGNKTTAAVANAILCGVLDNYVPVTLGATTATFQPNDGLEFKYDTLHATTGTGYNATMIRIPHNGFVDVKILSDSNYSVSDVPELDLTAWLVPRANANYSVGVAPGGAWRLTSTTSASASPLNTVLELERYVGPAAGTGDISDLYIEIGVQIYDNTSTGGGSGGPSAPTSTPTSTPIIVVPTPDKPDITPPDSGLVKPGAIIPPASNSNPDDYTVVVEPKDPESVTVNEDGSIVINEDVTDPQEIHYKVYNKAGTLIETITRIFYPSTLLIDIDGQHNWYLRGYEDKTMRAEGAITRAEVVTALYRLMNDSAKANNTETFKYSDVEYDAWYGMMVATLTNLKIVNGYDDGSFKPNAPISRAELAKIMSYFINHQDSNVSISFSDTSNHWATHFIELVAKGGLIVGYPDGTFAPNAATKRVEFATMINRLTKRNVSLENMTDGVEQFVDLDSSYWGYAEMMEAAHTHNYDRLDPNDVNYEEAWSGILGHGLSEVYNK